MQLRMWMYDLAREQAPTLDHLRDFLLLTEEAGYNAFGLYMEHRLAYASAPWASGKGCVTPEMIRELKAEFSKTPIIPFINLLGHFEGMIYTEPGKQYREALFQGLQACPSHPGFIQLCENILDETIATFDSEIIHIGGDETAQLGQCPVCKAKVEHENAMGKDGKAVLYGSHFGPLAHRVVQKGRRPAVWGDMFLEHPDALEFLPKETLIFDWQYFNGCAETSRKFKEKGFEVVCCPAIHTYNSVWCHLPQSEQNVADAVSSAEELGAYGVCLTTWECGLMGNYGTILPAVKSAGGMIGSDQGRLESNLAEPSIDPKSINVDPGDVKYEPTPQEPDPNTSTLQQIFPKIGVDYSISFILIDTIVARLLFTPGQLYKVLRDDSDCVIVDFAGHQAAKVPFEIWTTLQRRLQLLANIDPLQRKGTHSGTIHGEFRGEPFAVRVQVFLDSTTELLNLQVMSGGLIATPTPTLPRQGGGSHHSVDYFTLTDAPNFLTAYAEAGEQEGEWARLMGVELPKVGGVFGFSKTRSSLKVRLLLNANPFLCWMHHHEELCGPKGDEALAILEKAIHVAPNPSMRGVSEFVKLAIEFVRFADQARQAYAQGLPGVAVASLAPCRQIFEHLEKIAIAASINWGGSLADIERCRAAREHVERVIKRIRDYGDGSLGYLPAFEHLTHHKFMPYDQAAWWLINKWANE